MSEQQPQKGPGKKEPVHVLKLGARREDANQRGTTRVGPPKKEKA